MQLHYRSSSIQIVAICCVATLCFASCATIFSAGMLVNRIKNRGPIPVSSSNPHIASNQYLSQKRRQHTRLDQFLASHGLPSAIEIQKPLFAYSKAYLYYTESAQYFSLNEDTPGDVIEGPFPLAGRKLYQVRHALEDMIVDKN